MSRGLGRGGPLGQVTFGGIRAYTPTISKAGATVTSPAGLYLKLPGVLLIWASWFESPSSANSVAISLPTGFSVINSGAVPFTVGFVGANGAVGLTANPGATQVGSSAGTSSTVGSWSAQMSIPTAT